MKVLIIGAGGREHAIGKKIKLQNPETELFFAPGNGGTQQIGKNIVAKTQSELREFALKETVDLTIVGPEQPLVEGIVNDFHGHNLKIFGPDSRSAKLEGNKAFAKDFMQKYGVKTAAYQTFKHYVDAKEYIQNIAYPVVIKASGLAAGKGVVICQDEVDAIQCLKDMMLDKSFGQAGEEVVIEEYLEGFEASILSFYNKEEISPMLSAKDYKKIGEGDTGPNTGGMGAVVPNPNFKPEHFEDFQRNILLPTLKGLKQEALYFSGVIFFGLMITNKGCYLLEYNMRLGDPETQTLLPLLENNLLQTICDCIEGKTVHFEWKKQVSICVVMASGGYPRAYEKGFEIYGLEDLKPEDYDIAGATFQNPDFISSGGRVLNILAQDEQLDKCRETVYEKLKKIRFDYNYFRQDIGT